MSSFGEINLSCDWSGQKLELSVGKIANQATSAVIARMGDTVVMATLVAHHSSNLGFLPLTVNHQEKAYAAGKIPGGFFKREGRPTERETLISRLIDRPIRSLFPKDFIDEIQIITNLLSLDPGVEPDIPAMVAAMAALAISGLPIKDELAGARVALIADEFKLNPSPTELAASKLDLVLAGNSKYICMVESQANELGEDKMLAALKFGQEKLKPVLDLIQELKSKVEIKEWQASTVEHRPDLEELVEAKLSDAVREALKFPSKKQRKLALEEVKAQARELLSDEADPKFWAHASIELLTRKIARAQISLSKVRIDGRKLDEIREIKSEVGLLPRTHGSALFTRGETQALAVTTLGSAKDAQVIDGLLQDEKSNFMLHYNFPPFSVGEVGKSASPKRREIGHGKLAWRAMQAVLPDSFPYTIRVVSEIVACNGSSSQATICGASLALMDAGVPIKAPVAGIAMGLISENDQYDILSDIMGDEDALGDMDFKVAGTATGITALQMDLKITGIDFAIMEQALEQARVGRLHILTCMNHALMGARPNLSKFAPCISELYISGDKVREVIGKGGAVIKALTEEFSADIDIEELGAKARVCIMAPTQELGLLLKKRIEEITAEIEVDKIYQGKVMKILEFGAFVNLLPGKDGFLHISQIVERRLESVEEELSEGQEVRVKVLSIDAQGRAKVSMKVLAEEAE